METPTQEQSVEIRGEKIALRLDKTQGAIGLERIDEKIKFSPIIFWAGFRNSSQDKKFFFSSVVIPEKLEREKEQITPIGKAELIRWPTAFYGCELCWEIGFFPKEDFALFRIVFKNQTTARVLLDELCPFAYRGAGDGLEMGAGYSVWRFYRLSYQSWSPAGSINFQAPQARSRNFLARRIALAPYLWKREDSSSWTSEWMAEIVEPELDLAFLLGFITSKNQTGIISSEIKYERFRKLEAICDCEGIEVLPGGEVSSEWVLVMLTDTPRAGQKKYFELWAKAMSAKRTKPITGWSSWYFYFEKINLEKFEENLKSAKKLNPKIELFQLDDGYQTAVGDWLDWNEKFTIKPKALVEKIHQEGYKAGIWLAPFLASRESKLFERHSDWFLKNERGKPVLAMVNPSWKGLFAYALDATHPEFQRWLKELIEKLVKEDGFDFLKLDFIYSAVLPGKRYDPKITGAQALRKGLEIIRESVGDNCYILGCGAPLGTSIGLVDGMRVSQDIARKWSNSLDWLFGLTLTPCLRSCLKNNLARSLTAHRLWALDPDCLILSQGGKLTKEEIKSQLVIFYLLAGQALLSEEISKLNEEQLRWFSFCLPVAQSPAEPIDLFDREFPEEMFLSGERGSLLGLFNWRDEPKPALLNFKKYGLEGRYHIFEFWSQEYQGEVEGKIELGKITPHSVKYFSITPVSDQPEIIGLDFHLGMGTQGAKLTAQAGRYILELSLSGKRRGKVWLKLPKEKELRIVEVEFEDRLILEL